MFYCVELSDISPMGHMLSQDVVDIPSATTDMVAMVIFYLLVLFGRAFYLLCD